MTTRHALGAEFLGELIAGEGLTEPHLRVPKEAGDAMHILLPDRVEVRVRLVDSLGLLPAHRKGLVMRACEPLACAQLREDGLHVLDRAAHPLQFGVLKVSSSQGPRALRGH